MTGPSLDETDPVLIEALRFLFDNYGPAGVRKTVDKMIVSTVAARSETDGEILARMGTDAAKWTDEFLSRNLLVNRAGFTPEHADAWGSMVGWFANAIEAGRTAGRVETCPHSDRAVFGDLVMCRTCGATQESAPPAT